jgi:hypothetical protein
MAGLRALGVAHGRLTGTVPSELGALPSLHKALWLNGNQLTGPIPSELGRLSLYPADACTPPSPAPSPLPIAPTPVSTAVPTVFDQCKFGCRRNLLGDFPSLDLDSQMASPLLSHRKLSGEVPTPAPVAATYSYSYCDGAGLRLDHNNLCGAVPTEVEALHDDVFSDAPQEAWDIDTGNHLGTPCCEVLPEAYTCEPTASPTQPPTGTGTSLVQVTVGMRADAKASDTETVSTPREGGTSISGVCS